MANEHALFDPFFPKGLQWYWKGDFVTSLPDEAIDAHIAHAAAAPSALSLMHLYPIDGAVHRVPGNGTAWSARGATVIAGQPAFCPLDEHSRVPSPPPMAPLRIDQISTSCLLCSTSYKRSHVLLIGGTRIVLLFGRRSSHDSDDPRLLAAARIEDLSSRARNNHVGQSPAPGLLWRPSTVTSSCVTYACVC
jgi:hypothetical protein